MSMFDSYDYICTSIDDCEFRRSGLCKAGCYGEGVEKEDCSARIAVDQDNSELYRAIFRNQRNIFTTISKQKKR